MKQFHSKILGFIGKIVIEGIVIAVGGGLIVGYMLIGAEDKRKQLDQENQILFAETQNAAVACLILDSEKGITTYKYVTDQYLNNAERIRIASQKQESLIQQNLLEMRAANTILEAMLIGNLNEGIEENQKLLKVGIPHKHKYSALLREFRHCFLYLGDLRTKLEHKKKAESG